jgi:phosphatidylglycerophosphatase A
MNEIFIISLVIFRIFDITKPFFIKAIDRNFKNSFGVIIDDVIAGIYSGLSIIIIDKVIFYLTTFSG